MSDRIAYTTKSTPSMRQSGSAHGGSARGSVPTITLLRTIPFLAIGFAISVAVDASSIRPEPTNNGTETVARPHVKNDLPTGPEYELSKSAQRMTRTTQEIRSIVETMPGPNLPANRKTAETPLVQYAHPYEETLARLDHVGQLIADTTNILKAMPVVAVAVKEPKPNELKSIEPKSAELKPVEPKSTEPTEPPTKAEPTKAEPTKAEPTQPALIEPVPIKKESVSPAPSAPATPEATAPVSPETTSTGTAAKPKAGRRSITDVLTSVNIARLISIVVGALVALALVKYLPRIFRNARFERKQPLKPAPVNAIEAPPLKDQALELADIMASMGLTSGAAHALVEHIRANPRQALSHWLKLLDVYRQAGKREEFENAAEEIRTNFNVKPGAWNFSSNGSSQNSTLENYPHIAKQLTKLWPTPACGEFLLTLLADNREGKRAGFPLPVVEEIVLLLAVLRSEETPA